MKSLINEIYENPHFSMPEPAPGMGATLTGYTDRKAATVVMVFKIGKSLAVQVQQDKATRTDTNGMSDCQNYTYQTDPEGPRYTFKLDTKTGKWRQVYRDSLTGRWRTGSYRGLLLGIRDQYYDYSF